MINSFQDLLFAIGSLVNLLLPIAVAVALFLFLWGLFMFIRESGSEEKIKEGKSKMIWGIVILFVMTSIWGLVSFLQSSLFGFSADYGTRAPGGGYDINGDPCPDDMLHLPDCDFDDNGMLMPGSTLPTYGNRNVPFDIPVKSR